MHETLEQLEQLLTSEPVAAMATLVSAKGTTPKKAGAKMWVGGGGRILGSVTIGGCVDARVVAEAEAVLGTGTPRLLTMSLGDEEAWEIGLTCGGSVEVLVERVENAADDPVVAAYRAVRRELEANRGAVVVAPLEGGGRLVVGPAGVIEGGGSLGSAALDTAASSRGTDVRAVSRVDTVTVDGADVPLFFEAFAPPETMVVYGAGQVAMSLAVFARELGMRTAIVDGRERYATRERFPAADEIHVGIPSEIAERLPSGRNVYVVLVAHDYKYELPVLRGALRSELGYIGMLGSNKRGATVKQLLAEEGFTADELSHIHTPIGLDIGARSAAEIALSAIAEVIAVREGRATRQTGRTH